MHNKKASKRAPPLPHSRNNRIRIKPDVNLSLEYYISEQSAPISGVPGVKMDKSDVVSEILMNFLAEKGHYPLKCIPTSLDDNAKPACFGAFMYARCSIRKSEPCEWAERCKQSQEDS